MGWNSAGVILERVAVDLDKQLGFDSMPVLRSRKVAVLKSLINELENLDADTLDEQFGVTEALDMALEQTGWIDCECDGVEHQ